MRYVAALLTLFLLAAAATPAAAGPHHRFPGHTPRMGQHGEMGHAPRMHGPRARGPEGHRMMRPHGRGKPLGWLLHGIRRNHPGRHLDVRPVYGPDGAPHLLVKWLTPEGRVLWLDVDARSGQVINAEGAGNRWHRRDGD